jgi:uncharacterized protein (DUF952 family)
MIKSKFIHDIKYSYKILKPFEFEQFYAFGIFTGTQLDKSHGFIHLCKNPTQIANTICKFYYFESVKIVKFSNDKLVNLKFEHNKPGGEFYPHLYSHLTTEQIDNVYLLGYDKEQSNEYENKLKFLDKIIEHK